MSRKPFVIRFAANDIRIGRRVDDESNAAWITVADGHNGIADAERLPAFEIHWYHSFAFYREPSTARDNSRTGVAPLVPALFIYGLRNMPSRHIKT
jgi:hypothetical protein